MIDTATLQVQASIPTNTRSRLNDMVMVPASPLLIVSKAIGNSLLIVNTKMGLVEGSIDIGRNANNLATSPDGQFVYATHFNRLGVTVIDRSRT